LVIVHSEDAHEASRAILIAAGILGLVSIAAPVTAASESKSQITILYDAFGTDPSITKDWGFSALLEIVGKRLLFDTGNDADIFAANVKAKGVDLKTLDVVVLSHRHSDHMAGLNYVLSINPTVKIYAPKEGFGIFGSSLPSNFYRKDENLTPEMRYHDGAPQIMKFGEAWRGANFKLIEDHRNRAGHDAYSVGVRCSRHKELKELSLAINTPEGMVLVVGCSHPGIEKIVQATAAINRKIHLIAGGFHLVVASDDLIAKAVAALKDMFKVESIAPGHCTGEPTFAASKKAFGDRYLYAGLGTTLPLGALPGSDMRRGDGPALQQNDLNTYRRLARRGDPFGILQARSLRTKTSGL
jgi:7,8-dihydropterin-6-yl-methyl-4-(beta-D-ribofuranosyl)aminobenzene 5'-phosphate synthase